MPSSGVAAFGAGFQARFQAGLDEFVQIAVEHLLRVAAFDAGAQILDARSGPARSCGSGCPSRCRTWSPPPRPSRRCASGFPARTAWPRSIFIARSRLACWNARSGRPPRCRSGTWVMRTADSVLLTCWPPAPERGTRRCLQVGRVDLDLDVVVDFGRHEHRGETGVAAVVRIERRLAHQPMHAGFGLQPAVGVVALDAEGGALDAGHFAAADFQQLGFPAARSAQRRYMRSSISAQSCASVPPAPAWMSTKALAPSILPENMRWNSSFPPSRRLRSTSATTASRCLRRSRIRPGRAIRRPRTGRRAGADAVDGLSSMARSAQRLGALGIVPDIGVFQFAADFFQTFDLGRSQRYPLSDCRRDG
jgi:hypothetical protein